MATSAWFNYNGYMNNKLAQLQKAEPAAGWNMEKLVKTFSDVGFVGDVGAEMHFEQYGQYENVAPNAFFNATEYLRAKAAQFYGIDAKAVTDLQAADMQVAIQKAGMSAWSHYEKYGSTEKVNPSNSFDTEAYMNAKLVAVNAVPGGKQYTLPELYEAFQAAGYSALEHFMIYGGNGGAGEVTQKIVDGKIPTEFSVPENKKVNPGGSSDGETFALTAGIDNITGTAGNDVFIAGQAGGVDTLNAGDQLNGGDGIDTLKIYAGVDNFSGATLKSIEIVEDYDGTDAINVSANADIKELWLNKASMNAATAAKTQIIGFGDAAGGAAAVGTFTGTGDAATIALKDAGKTTAYTSIEVAGIKNLTVDASGSNQIGDLIAAAAETITIKGTGSVTAVLAPNATVLKSVDASANTGGVNLGLTAAQFGTNDVKVTGGAGDDTVTFSDVLTKKTTIDMGEGKNTLNIFTGTTLAAGSTVKAGSGTADTLVLNAVTGINATVGKMFTGFENLKLAGTTSSYKVGDIAGITGYEIATTTSGTLTNLADGTNVKVSGAAGVTLTLADNSDATSSVKVTLDNGASTAASGVVLNALATNAHVLNIDSMGLTDATHNDVTLSGASLTDVTNVKITGTQALDFTSGAAALTKIDGSAATGKLDIDAATATKAMTILGGTADDTIVASGVSGAISTITGGKGADSITLGTAANTAGDIIKLTGQADSTAAGFDKVTNFADGTSVSGANADILDLKAFGFEGAQADFDILGATKVTVSSSGATATFTISDANAKDFFAFAGADMGVALHSANTQTFVFIDADKNGDWNADTDSVVLLVGDYSSNALTDANFAFA